MTLPWISNRRVAEETLLFWSLLVLHLAPLLIFPFIPTQDGPGHQAVASILRQYDQPAAGLLREYYRPNGEALPNRFIFFMMDGVLGKLPVPGAEKVLLCAYVLLLPLSVRYVLKAIHPEARFLSLLAFPFLFNFTFQMGFFNFCFSLPGFFLAVGYWLKHQREMTALRVAGLGVLVLWVYFCHPVTLVVTVATLLTLAGWRALLELRETGRLAASLRHWLLAPALACLPALVLMASFVQARTDARITSLPLWVKLKHLAGLYSLASVSRWTIPLAAALALLFYGLVWLGLRARGRKPLGVEDGLLLAVGVLLLAYLTAPSELSGGGFITHRLNLFPFLALILWFATCSFQEAWRRWIQVAAVGISLAFLGVFVWWWAGIDRGLAEIVAAESRIEPDHTLLFLSYAHHGEGAYAAFRTNPYVHAGGYIAARKRLVDLSLYQANENYFPIYYEPRLNPYTRLATVPLGVETEPPRVDLLRYMKSTGARVDYVLIWGLRDARTSDPAVREVVRELAAAYEPVDVPGDGAVQLFELRDLKRSRALASAAPLKELRSPR